MQALILAAGMGRRLGEYTENNTKCMVEVNGVKLIDRLLGQLSRLKLERAVIVVGYEGRKLMDYVGDACNGLKIEYVENPVYDRTNNIYSLALAKEQLMADDTLLIESDLIFDDEMLDLLIDAPQPNLALVAKYESWMDGTMVCIDGQNNIVNFVSKDAFDYKNAEQYYKTVNIYKFSKEFSRTRYVPFLEAYLTAVGHNEYYENVLRILSFLNCSDLKALPITSEKWYEIDDKQDLDIAEALFADADHVLKKYYRRYGGYWRFPKMLDFCYLVNPYFPSERLMNEMRANFNTLLTQYPSGMAINTLVASKCWGVKEEYLIPGNGAAELIKLYIEGLQGKLGIIRPTFEEYPNRFDKSRLETFVPQNDEYRYGADDLMTYFEAHPVDTLLVINPDNPSGNFIRKNDLLRLIDWCGRKDMDIVVDESFVDFSEEWETSTLLNNGLLEKNPHLIVMKSISKSYGVPGLRLGILASGNTALIANLKAQTSIWNLNSFAEYFMQIFNKYEKDYKTACRQFVEERRRFEKDLRTVEFLRVMPSEANYFLCEILPPYNATEIVIRMLKEHNILTRDCSVKGGFDGKSYMRIAVRGREDNERLVRGMKALL